MNEILFNTFSLLLLYLKLTFFISILPLTFSKSTASSSSKISISWSIISVNLSIPVIPRWNCSVNSTILLTVVSSVWTYRINATMSPLLIFPSTRKSPPNKTTIMYIIPSNAFVIVLNPAIDEYVSDFISKNFLFPFWNFSISTSSFANDFTTLTPSKLSSMSAFKTPMWCFCSLKPFLILLLYLDANTIISGIDKNKITVNNVFNLTKIANETIILISPMKYSSGQWCENSVISNKSDVILAIICPTFVSLKYESESFCKCWNTSYLMSVSIFAPIMWPVFVM